MVSEYIDLISDLARAVPEKYSHIDFTPSDGMVEEAERGLAWREEHGRGGTEVGVARARDISNRRTLSPETTRRMKAYFDRHEVDQQGQGWSPGEDGYPSAGRIAWALWGGDPGYAWARQRVESMDAADNQSRTDAPSLRSLAAAAQTVPMFRFVDRAVDLDEVEGVIRGYIFVWGDSDHRDSYDTWFDKSRPPQLDIDNGAHRRPLKYEHCDDDQIGFETIGWIERVWFDDTGLAYEGRLERTSPHYPRIVSELRQGALKTSSGTMPHTANFHEDGAFQYWTLGELSLTAYPAEPRMPATTIVRSEADPGDRQPDSTTVIEHDGTEGAGAVSAPQLTNSPFGRPFDSPLGQRSTSMMTLEQIMAALPGLTDDQYQAILAALNTAPPTEDVPAELADAPMTEDEQDEAMRSTGLSADVLAALRSMQASLAAMQQQQVTAPPARTAAPRPTGDARRTNGNGSRTAPNLNFIYDKFARRSNDELFLAAEVLSQHKVPLSENLRTVLAHRGFDHLRSNATETSTDSAITHLRSRVTRADELMATDISGKGTEWAGVFYGGEIWQKARQTPILAELLARGMMEREVPDGATSVVIPLESTDPTVYTTSQSNDKDATGNPEVTANLSFAGTSNVTVTPGQLTTAIAYTDILEEDSFINGGLVAQLNDQINQVMIRQPEYVLMNGDTETAASTNINLIDSTPGTGLDKPNYLVSNGALKLGLVTATAQSFDAGTLDDDDFNRALSLLDADAQADPDRTVFVMDVHTWQRARTLVALKTMDVAGGSATLFGTDLPDLYGVRALRTGQMAKANTAGKISATPGNNTKGRFAALYAPYWVLVWKRRLRFETARFPLSDTNVLIASMRLAVRYRSTSAVAVAYNITV